MEMAIVAIGIHEWICLYCCFNSISSIKIMNTIIQNILVFSTLALAVIFLVRKFIWKPKKATKSCGANDDCGCH
ncbi:FeoB-associated Cys-rich membrane protein [Winogradskyella sp.]|uniref:FeoB-associated Cys-rich membrane protein n=1 Tax=Winogradskyella sp. TaxID=1883156 RepID=UPI0034487643